MENQVKFINQALVVTPRGLDKLWSLKKSLTIPLAHLVGATIDPGILHDFKGIRAPGAAIPGHYYAGTFYLAGEKTFFNVKRGSQPVVVQLRDEDYVRLVLGVADPRGFVDWVNRLVQN